MTDNEGGSDGDFHGRQFQLLGAAMYRSFRCLWMLEELQIPYKYIPAQPQGQSIKSVNPLGKVPALIETHPSSSRPFCMYESAAINTYLGDMAYTLAPPTGRERLVPPPGTHLRGLYEQTVSCIITELDAQALWIHRKHHDMGQYFGHIPEAVQTAKDHFIRVNKVLAAQLHTNGGQYLVGQSFTAADILYVHCLGWSIAIGWHDGWQDDAKLQDYVRRCRQREAYQKVAAIRDREKAAFQEKAKM
ncbi:glutathione Stransferase [Seminavis robusta]|uniref:Glutathione Stransferase n=1 Tax=Seminavis robusta TaxID=568900 RepID=A0A9N8H1M8_9STRA|nr:glutathione Stransferase [Seminavis robusta]|eukprot:Sro20_g013900.1 glutathione Stransferase (246) ;mRNA; f:32508-33245